jgi:hypothetical protein
MKKKKLIYQLKVAHHLFLGWEKRGYRINFLKQNIYVRKILNFQYLSIKRYREHDIVAS